MGGSALALVAVQLIYVAIDSAILIGTADLRFSEVVGANFFLAGAMAALAGSFIAFETLIRKQWHWARLGVAVLTILGGSLLTSHAAARMEDRLILGGFTFVHQAATGGWIGSLPYLLMLLRTATIEQARTVSHRFSRLALGCVGLIVLAGAGLSFFYIRTPDAFYGTSYGIMTLSKVIMLGMLLILGGMNFFAVRILDREPLLLRLRRFVEVEVGIGFTVILAAASLTSQPPAVDLSSNRVTAQEIVQRMAPRWPRMQSPSVSELSPATPLSSEEATAPGFQGNIAFVPGQVFSPYTQADIA
ncbi:MAG: CopD family protein [Terriglobia bacterium]